MRVSPDPKAEDGDNPREADAVEAQRSAGERSRRAGEDGEDGALLRDGVTSAALSARGTALRSLLASARHELRSPLQSIQGFAELLDSEAYGGLSPEQQLFVGHILQGSSDLNAILEACLDLTELELLREPLEPALVDAQAALVEALSRAAEARCMPLEPAPLRVLSQQLAWLDPEALRRALSALLTGLGAGLSKPFRVDVEYAVDQAVVRMSAAVRTHAPTLSVSELSERRRSAPGLVWLRLAAALLERQSGLLLVNEPLDYAEVRLRLSHTH